MFWGLFTLTIFVLLIFGLYTLAIVLGKNFIIRNTIAGGDVQWQL